MLIKFILLLSLLPNLAHAQFYIDQLNVNQTESVGKGSAAASSAVLDVVSITKGALLPRMTTTQKNAIASPATGLLVYDTSLGLLYQYNGSSWISVGNTGTVTSVGLSVPAFLSISGSPITGSGTLAITLSGTALPSANGGTGLNTSASTGVPVLSSGTWAVSSNLDYSRGGTGQGSAWNADGVIYAATSATLASTSSGVVGTALIGNGASSAPSFSSALQLGVNGTTAGSVGIGTSSPSGQFITIQNPGGTTAYNFNLPLTAGSSGQVLTSQGGGSTAMNWTSSLTNPMNTLGDVIYGGAAGAATRLAGNSTTTPKVLTSTGTGSAAQAPTLSPITALFLGGQGNQWIATFTTLPTSSSSTIYSYFVVGGGGGGGGCNTTTYGAGGGGAGALAYGTFSGVSASTSVTITTGGSGGGGNTSGGNGGAGGASSIAATGITTITAGGGGGGNGCGTGFVGGSGGTVTSGSPLISLSGGAGGYGSTTISGVTGLFGGVGAAGPFGGGGTSGTDQSGVGFSGTGYGSGGGGAIATGAAGGAGAAGIVIITQLTP